MKAIIFVCVLVLTGVLIAQNLRIEDGGTPNTHCILDNSNSNVRIGLRVGQRLRSIYLTNTSHRQSFSANVEISDLSPASMCYSFQGVISTAAKTPDYYTIIAYEAGGGLLNSNTDDFTFPTPCSYYSPVFAEPHVDALAIAYDANGHCIGKDFVEDLWVNSGTGFVDVDFYCE